MRCSTQFLFIFLCLLACTASIEEENLLLNGETEESSEQDNHDSETTRKSQEKLITIAEHLRSDPNIVSEFKPSALRAVVSNPKSLAILPLPIIDQIINDPIFSVSLPQKEAQLLTAWISQKTQEKIDDYDDYDIDYGDAQENVNSFIGDLDPDFLKTIDPDVIVAYFENASPNDLKAILSNSSILASLPAKTIGSLLGKLKEDLLIRVLESQAIRDLYNSTYRNLTQAELNILIEWQTDVAEHIVYQVNASVLEHVPEFIVKGQVGNKRALTALLRHPDKLMAITRTHPDILNQIPPDVILDIVSSDVSILNLVPLPIFNRLATCDLVRRLSERYTATQLIKGNTDKFVNLFLRNPEIVDCVADVSVADFVRKIFEDALWMDEKEGQRKNVALLNHLTSAVLSLPEVSLVRLASRPDMLHALPEPATIRLVNERPKLVSLLPKEIILALARSKPWLIGEFGATAVLLLAERNEVLNGLSNPDLSNLMAFQPTLITILTALPSDVVTEFLSNHLGLFDMIPPSAIPHLTKVLQNKDLIREIPSSLHALLAEKPVVQKIIDKFTVIDILDSHPDLVIRLSLPVLKKLGKRFLDDPWFRERLPCTCVDFALQRPIILDIIPDSILSKVMTSVHILSCVNLQQIEEIMAKSRLASRLPLSTLVNSARSLRVSQMSFRLALNFLTKQVPQSNAKLFFS